MVSPSADWAPEDRLTPTRAGATLHTQALNYTDATSAKTSFQMRLKGQNLPSNSEQTTQVQRRLHPSPRASVIRMRFIYIPRSCGHIQTSPTLPDRNLAASTLLCCSVLSGTCTLSVKSKSTL